MKTKFVFALHLTLMAVAFPLAVFAQDDLSQPDPFETPVPAPTPIPIPAPEPPNTTQIFKIVFSAETLTEAIARALNETARNEVEALSGETAQLTSLLGSLLHPPEDGYFGAVGSAGLPTAAALAPALFLLRLALHHWRRLMGEDEGLLVVVGDWVTAGVTAAGAGHFLDLLVQAGWWSAGAALGEIAGLARDFLSISLVTNVLRSFPLMGRPSIFAAIFAVGGGLGGLLGVAGLGFAFAAAEAVMFVLAAAAPVLMVLAVLPQMRWLRGLWLKAVCIQALIPVAAGGIFKAAVVLAVSFGGNGYGQLVIRLLWLWGAVGFLISLAGILSRVTLSAAVESADMFVGGVRSLVSVAAQASGGFDSTAAAVQTNMVGIHGGNPTGSAGLPTRAEAGSIPRSADVSILAPHFAAAGLNPQWAQTHFPDETERMVAHYSADPGSVDAAPEPLTEVARMANASELLAWLETKGGSG